jgi:hypothetical protein
MAKFDILDPKQAADTPQSGHPLQTIFCIEPATFFTQNQHTLIDGATRFSRGEWLFLYRPLSGLKCAKATSSQWLLACVLNQGEAV